MRHFKQVLLSAATGLSAILFCAPAASAAGADSFPPGETVFQLVAKQTQGTFVDVDGSSGPSQGDECAADLTLPLGQLTAQGRFTVTAAGPGNIDFAITGGTGRYRTAHGSVHAVNVSDTETNLTVHLIR
ncbi:hypothetical protein XF35_38790 [Streptomyces platensis subsp. clarensis]|nr:hypothetical protein [Streptomyces platensis subsp. clarensis]